MKGTVGEGRKSWFENQRKESQKILLWVAQAQESASQDLKLEELVMLKVKKGCINLENKDK